MECFVARKLARDLKDREILSANRGVGVGGVQTRKMQLHLHMMYMKDSRGKNNGCGK